MTNTTGSGVTIVKDSVAYTFGSLVVNRSSGDGKTGDSVKAQKNWVDANIQITPATAFNEVGSPHVLTGHVNVNDGTGFVNAPAGTTIHFTIVSGPGVLSASSCVTITTTGSCTVTLTNTTGSGVTVFNDSVAYTFGSLTINRASGDGKVGDSVNAQKNWVDANIQITPATAYNALGSPHVLTGHVNVNDGTGFANAPVGTTINFSIVSGLGSLSASSCTTLLATGSCTVTLPNTTTTGVTIVKDSVAYVRLPDREPLFG